MTRAETWTTDLYNWRAHHALPLWTSAGIDPVTNTAWEALDHQGRPLRDLNRRQRVQFRQANVFAQSPDIGIQALGWQLFRRTMDHGFDPNTGLFSTWTRSDLTRLDQTHDLYDLAFGLLAAASLGQSGFDVAADISRLEQALDVLRASVGWFETPTRRLPRRQNSHMHLFEAATALYALTGSQDHRKIAQRCLEIIAKHALKSDGTLLEFFDPDWVPLTGEQQAIEPGHLAEWIFLADRFTTLTRTASGLPLTKMWETVLAHRLPSGFLPDIAGQTMRRLWPQTELLKAATVMQRHGHILAPDACPAQMADALWNSYLNTSVEGGWYDRFNDETGALTSSQMPASSFYHIDLAIDACLNLFD